MIEWLAQLTPPAEVKGPALTAYVLLDVFLVVILARVLGNLMMKLKQPRVVGEILAGLLLGPTLLGDHLSKVIAPLEARPVLGIIATFGLILFMFVAGLEFDLERIKGRLAQAGLLAVLSVILPTLFGFPVARFIHSEAYFGPAGSQFLPFALLIGAGLSVTAFPVMAHILMERGELNSPIGSLAVAAAGVISVLMFINIGLAGAVASAIASNQGYSGFILNLIFIVLFGILAWFVVRPLLARFIPAGAALTGNHMAVIFGGMVLFGLIAHLIGINALVGGFVWGMILPAAATLRQAIALKVRDVAMVFLLPVFFANAGFSADLKLLTAQTIPAVLVVLLAAIASKFLAVIPAKVFGLSWGEVGTLGALFNTRGLLMLVVGVIGLQMNLITNLTFTIIVVVSLTVNLMTLPLLNWFSPTRK